MDVLTRLWTGYQWAYFLQSRILAVNGNASDVPMTYMTIWSKYGYSSKKHPVWIISSWWIFNTYQPLREQRSLKGFYNDALKAHCMLLVAMHRKHPAQYKKRYLITNWPSRKPRGLLFQELRRRFIPRRKSSVSRSSPYPATRDELPRKYWISR